MCGFNISHLLNAVRVLVVTVAFDSIISYCNGAAKDGSFRIKTPPIGNKYAVISAYINY